MEQPNPETVRNPGQDQFEQDVLELAAWSHDIWREDRRYRNASTNVLFGHFRKGRQFKPRPKSTTDEMWIAEHDGQTTVDIANVAFVDLPTDRQEETIASARTAMNEAYKVAFYGQGQYREGQNFLFFQHLVKFSGSNIHNEWLKRNSAWAPPSQQVPFGYLSVAEQKKDEDFYVGAANIVNRHLQAGNLVVPDQLILDWCKSDCEWLRNKYAESYWQPQISEPQLAGPNRIQIAPKIASDKLELDDGIYPLDITARFIRGLCDLSPDPTEVGLCAIGGNAARRDHIIRPFIVAIAAEN